MKYFKLGQSSINASSVGLGLMRIVKKSEAEATEAIKAALDVGINFFDHADMYANGESEIMFARIIKKLGVKRSSYYLQSKVGIRRGFGYDFSFDHIMASVDEILARLETTYLDVLLLHRPDMLWEPEEIVKAFKLLKESGKVHYFGVSNMNQFQISYLQSKLPFPLIINQLQYSIMHSDLSTQGVFVNSPEPQGGYSGTGVLDYLRQHEITMQAWSPFMYGKFKGVFLDNKEFPELNKKLNEVAKTHGVTAQAIAVAWISRHPANIQTIIGTITPQRIIESARGADVVLTRAEWYEIYLASGKILP